MVLVHSNLIGNQAKLNSKFDLAFLALLFEENCIITRVRVREQLYHM